MPSPAGGHVGNIIAPLGGFWPAPSANERGAIVWAVLLDENYRKAWHARFAYGMYYQDGRFVPCG